MGDVAVQEPLTADVETTPSKKRLRSPSRFRRFVVVACLGMAAYYAYANRPVPEIDYAEIVPPIAMISATHDGDGEGWLADGKALNPNVASRVRDESADNDVDGGYQSLLVWRMYGEKSYGISTTWLQIFDVHGGELRGLGSGSGTANRWNISRFRFAKDAVLPDVVDLKWRFGPDEDQRIDSIESDGSNLPIYLPDGSRIIQVGDSTELVDHGVEPKRLYVRTEHVRQPDGDVSISLNPRWKFPRYSLESSSNGNPQRLFGQWCNWSDIYHWDRPLSEVRRVDIVVRPMRTAVYRNVATTLRNTPSDFYVAIEPRHWSVTPALSIEESDFGDGTIEIEVTWPATAWRLRNPESQRRWKSYLRFNGVEKEWTDGPPPFESTTATFNFRDVFGVTYEFPDAGNRYRRPDHLQYVIKDVDVVHPDHEGRVYHLPEIKSWSNSLRRRQSPRPEEHVVQASR